MTRKDYIAIAAALSKAYTECGQHEYAVRVGVKRASIDIADALAADNPRFDRERFLKACGVTV